MQWKEFDPGRGRLRAEGRNHLFTSRIVRSIGICLEYTATSSISDSQSSDPAKIDTKDIGQPLARKPRYYLTAIIFTCRGSILLDIWRSSKK